MRQTHQPIRRSAPDGNKVIGRIHLQRGHIGFAYMAAVENASVRHDISDFARFVPAEMAASAELKGPKQ